MLDSLRYSIIAAFLFSAAGCYGTATTYRSNYDTSYYGQGYYSNHYGYDRRNYYEPHRTQQSSHRATHTPSQYHGQQQQNHAHSQYDRSTHAADSGRRMSHAGDTGRQRTGNHRDTSQPTVRPPRSKDQPRTSPPPRATPPSRPAPAPAPAVNREPSRRNAAAYAKWKAENAPIDSSKAPRGRR